MQSLYEKDKIFALQYIAADGSSKITYRSDASEEQRLKAACKRKARQFASSDKTASLGPPDKKQHFETKSQPPKKAKCKQDSKTRKCVELDLGNGEKHEVEVCYNDGMWYRGWLSTFNIDTGKWIVKFYDDDETTEVDFPDEFEDVRPVKK